MDSGINKRLYDLKNRVSDHNEQSPMSYLTKKLMDVHIDSKPFTKKPSLSSSEDSVYFSAKSSQSFGDDDRTSISSKEELNSTPTPAQNFEDDIDSSDSSDTLQLYSERHKTPDRKELVNDSLLKKFDPLFISQNSSSCSDALPSTDVNAEYDYDEFAHIIDPNIACNIMHEVVNSNTETEVVVVDDDGKSCKLLGESNEIEDEFITSDAANRLIVNMHVVIQDLLSVMQQKENVFDEQTEMLSLRNEQLQSDLFNIETSYAQLHDRYEKLRVSLEDAVKAAEEWKSRADEHEDLVEYERQRYQKLKMTCEDKLVDILNDRERLKSEHEVQIHTMEATLRKNNLTIEDLNRSLTMKNDQIIKLNKLCDDVLKLNK